MLLAVAKLFTIYLETGQIAGYLNVFIIKVSVQSK
jgi:hypothetical protein